MEESMFAARSNCLTQTSQDLLYTLAWFLSEVNLNTDDFQKVRYIFTIFRLLSGENISSPNRSDDYSRKVLFTSKALLGNVTFELR